MFYRVTGQFMFAALHNASYILPHRSDDGDKKSRRRLFSRVSYLWYLLSNYIFALVHYLIQIASFN